MATRRNYTTIGYQGENRWDTITISIADLVKKYPGGYAYLYVVRAGDDEGYIPRNVEQTENALLWTPDDYDTEYDGILKAQAMYVVNGDVVGKTQIFIFNIDQSLTSFATRPATYEDWVNGLLQAATNVNSEIDAAEATLDGAVEAALAAQAAAEAAQTAAERAQHTAENAKTSAAQSSNAAYNYAADANRAKRDATTAKDNAVQAKGDAELAKTAAETAKDNANTSALKSEGYAVGTQDGVAAGEGEPYFHDNAKYYKELAEAAKVDAIAAKERAEEVVDGIEDAGANQITAIQAKGEQTLESIPEDYTELYNDIDSIVLVQPDEPEEEMNRIWIESDTLDETSVPEMSDLEEVEEEVTELKSTIDYIETLSGTAPTIMENYRINPEGVVQAENNVNLAIFPIITESIIVNGNTWYGTFDDIPSSGSQDNEKSRISLSGETTITVTDAKYIAIGYTASTLFPTVYAIDGIQNKVLLLNNVQNDLIGLIPYSDLFTNVVRRGSIGERNGGFLIKSDYGSGNACYVCTKRGYSFYKFRAKIKVDNLSSNYISACRIWVPVNINPFEDENPSFSNKLSVDIGGTWIRVIVSDTNEVLRIAHVLTDAVELEIERTSDRYVISVNGSMVIVQDSEFTDAYNFKWMSDYIAFGNCTNSLNVVSQSIVKVSELSEKNYSKSISEKPLLFSGQTVGDTDTEKMIFPMAYMALDRASEAPSTRLAYLHFTPGGGYNAAKGSWTWDSFFNTIGACHFGEGSLQVAKADYLAHESNVYGAGLFSSQIRENSSPLAYTQPWNAQMALMISKQLGDYSWFDYAKLKQNVFAWDVNKQANNGLYTAYNGWETGLDNTTALFWPLTMEQVNADQGKMISVMYSSLMYNEYKALAELSLYCGDSENTNSLLEKAETIRTLINQILWDSTDKFYYCMNKETGVYNKRKHIENICFAMYAGVPTEEIAEEIALQLDSDDWIAQYGLYTVNKQDASYMQQENGVITRVNWDGPAWMPTTYTMCTGLYRYGYTELADKIVERTNKAIKHFMLTGNHAMPEYWNPDDLTPWGYLDYTWGLCCAFIDYEQRHGNLHIF